MTWKCCEFTVKQSFFWKELACWRWFFKFMVWTNSKVLWSGMPLVFVLPSATGWASLPAGSGCTLSTPRCWRWAPRLLFTSCWLSGEICAITWRRRREIPGIICRYQNSPFSRLSSQSWLSLIIHAGLLLIQIIQAHCLSRQSGRWHWWDGYSRIFLFCCAE